MSTYSHRPFGQWESGNLLPEAGRVVVALGTLFEFLVIRMQFFGALDQQILALAEVGVGQTTFNGANGLAGLVIEKPDTFGTKFGVNHVDLISLGNRFVGTFWFTSTAVDAIGSDIRGHSCVDGKGSALLAHHKVALLL
jgi:hypothetical protein